MPAVLAVCGSIKSSFNNRRSAINIGAQVIPSRTNLTGKQEQPGGFHSSKRGRAELHLGGAKLLRKISAEIDGPGAEQYLSKAFISISAIPVASADSINRLSSIKTSSPSLKRAAEEFGEDGLVVLGISLDANRDRVRSFAETRKIGFPILCDEKGWKSPVVKKYGVTKLPATYLVDRSGEIRAEIRVELPMGNTSLHFVYKNNAFCKNYSLRLSQI